MPSYDIIEKESEYGFHMIYYSFFYALAFKIFANWKKLLYSIYANHLTEKTEVKS